MGDDGHTYEREAIIDWLTRNGTSPITKQPMDIKSLTTNLRVKKMIEEFKSMLKPMGTQYHFELGVDIRKTEKRPIFETFGKSIYKVEWIDRDGPPIILLKIDRAKANRESSFYVQLSCHPHIIRTFGLVQSKPGSVMLLQEFALQGNLSGLLRENDFKPTERVLRTMFEQICDALICLADNGIVHADLACRNVLVFQSSETDPKKNLVKLTDFGLSRDGSLFSVVDTPTKTIMSLIPTRYAAPELFLKQTKSSYSEKTDMYSMGVLMWQACSYGELPYSHLDDDEDVRREKLKDRRLSRPELCSDQLWTIINECWQLDPEYRPDFKSLKQSLLNIDFQAGKE
jgi:serine/threonine protein kinase